MMYSQLLPQTQVPLQSDYSQTAAPPVFNHKYWPSLVTLVHDQLASVGVNVPVTSLKPCDLSERARSPQSVREML